MISLVFLRSIAQQVVQLGILIFLLLLIAGTLLLAHSEGSDEETIIIKRAFSEVGLNEEKIWKELVQNGHLTKEGYTIGGFKTLKQTFKDAFPEYGEKEFNQIESILQSSEFRAYPNGVIHGKPVTPGVFMGDLRDLPNPPVWKPGDPIRVVPRRFYPQGNSNLK